MAKVSVIGAGSWGTALAVVLQKNGHKVTVWSILEDEIKMLSEKREHVDKLPGVKLAENIEFTTELKGGQRHGYGCACRSFAFYQKHICKYETLCGG